MKRVLLFFALALAGCASRVVVKDRVSTVSVPVATGCVAGERPEAVTPLATAHPDWLTLTPRQKAALVAAQALRHQNRAARLEAATGACR